MESAHRVPGYAALNRSHQFPLPFARIPIITFLRTLLMEEVTMKMARWIALLAGLPLCLGSILNAQGQSKKDLSAVHARLTKEIRHALIMLPNYGLFDHFEFGISDVDTVTLSGYVTRPTLKSDAERVVRNIEGVGKLVNKIEVLPVSPSDERIRVAAYRAIFSKPGLDLYGMQAVPPIHIIVKNGTITLVGMVATEMEKNLAGMAAREVPGAFGVTNNLRVER
jgi:hyperosmotically inducible protein